MPAKKVRQLAIVDNRVKMVDNKTNLCYPKFEVLTVCLK